MGKIAIWVLVILAGLLLYRLFGQGRKKSRRDVDAADVRPGPGEKDAAGPDGRREELILACAVCGVHVPSSEARFARGRAYCCEAHRDGDADRG